MRLPACYGSLIVILLVTYCCHKTGEPKEKSKGKGTLRIIHAGSMTVPVKEIAAAFREENPGVKILTEAWGSKAGARRISDLNQPCDVFVSADYKVIDRFLIPEHASWNIPFAGNEMVVAFNPGSRYAGIFNSGNWFDILLREDVIYGRSDPNSDPCGVRAVLTLKLAGKYYGLAEYPERLLERHRNFIRPKETDLLALLEKNVLDYIFIYKSVAEQHGLKYIVLPDEINLGNPELNELYSEVQVEVTGTRPGETYMETGEAMVYGITVPSGARNKKLAMDFVRFFLSDEQGLKILAENGQKPLVPSVSSTYENVPPLLKPFARQPDGQ